MIKDTTILLSALLQRFICFPRLAKLFYKEPESEYCRVCGPLDLFNSALYREIRYRQHTHRKTGMLSSDQLYLQTQVEDLIWPMG